MTRPCPPFAALSISLLALLAAGPIHGQEAAEPAPGGSEVLAQIGVPAPPPAPEAPTTPAAPAVVDETALRYFARQGDTQRVDAEIARLRLLYPDWQPPQDLLSNDFTPDPMIERIWELYGEGDFAGARAAIAEKQVADPDWQPTEDMVRSLQTGEAAVRMRNASDSAQYETVISIAANMPDLLVCANVDLLWRLADAFIQTDHLQRGIDAYVYVLGNCENPEERFATLQQASERLTEDQLTPLLALERMTPEGVGEFEPLRIDIARNAIVAVLAGQQTRADPADVSRIEASVATSGSVDDMRLLGWYALNRNRAEDAVDWFEAAMDTDPSAVSANGLGTALLELDRMEEGEAVLADYIGDTEEVMALYLATAAALLAQTPRLELSPTVLNRIVTTAYEAESVQVSQELGWYALAFEQPATAIAWFETALGWDGTDEPSAYGLVVASDRTGDAARVSEIQRQWAGRSERIAQYGTAETAEVAPATAPVQAARPAEAPRAAAPAAAAPAAASTITVTYQGCTTYAHPSGLSPAQALTRGWCLMDMLRPAEAVENFARALQSTSQATRSDASYGQALAYIRMGLAEHAAVAAAAAPQPRARVVELQTSILTLTAISAYQTGDYRRALTVLDERSMFAPEQNDLLVLRAWSYFHLGRHREALQIFTAVAGTGLPDAADGLAALAAAGVR